MILLLRSPLGFAGNDSSITPLELFNLATLKDVWGLVREVEFDLIRPNEKGETKVIQREGSQSLSFTELRKRPFAKCYSLFPEENIRKYGVSRIELK